MYSFDALIDAHLHELDALTRAHSVPIFACLRDNGRPRPLGTGFFFRCAEEWFLITACHVMDDIFPKGGIKAAGRETPNESLLLVPNVDESLIDVSGWICSNREFDVAVLKLDDAAAVQKRWKPVTLADIHRPDDDPQGQCFHFGGWPIQAVKRGEKTFESAACYSFNGPFDPGPFDCDPGAELFVSIGRGSLADPMDAGLEVTRVPYLEGVSGSPMWRVFDRAGRFIPRLAGVQTGYFERGQNWYIRGVRSGAVLLTLERAAPEVMAAAAKIFHPA